MARQRVDWVIVLGEPMFFAERRRIDHVSWIKRQISERRIYVGHDVFS
jgi:hypothetical protein